MGESSRESSRAPILQIDDTTSLTSFPDPTAPDTPQDNGDPHTAKMPLDGLLDVSGPSMFDENKLNLNDPQVLSAAPSHVLQGVIDHHGALQLVQRLSAMLAERDAHVTALTRLAQDYNAPPERISETASRIKQSERRRLSLAGAMSDNLLSSNGTSSNYEGSALEIAPRVTSGGTIKGLTKLFGGKTGVKATKRESNVVTPGSSRSTSRSHRPSISQQDQPKGAAKAVERPRSVDAQSTESNAWTSHLLSMGNRRRDSREVREPVEMTPRHDPDQLPPTLVSRNTNTIDRQEAEWNRFIMKLNKAREESGDQAENGEMIGAARFGREGNLGHKKMESLARLVVGGVPMKLRHPIWMELSNAYALMVPDAYQHYLSLRDSNDAKEIEAIQKDLPRTLTNNTDFYTNKGKERLRKVLVAFVGKYEDLGYTQGLNMVAGYLLLAIPAEEDAFWVLCNMVENFFPANYFSRDMPMSGPLTDSVVLRQYVKEMLPDLSRKMDDMDLATDHTVPLGWFMTAFASVLDTDTLLRVWDVMLCLPNQRTFVFNAAVALLQMHADRLMECDSIGSYLAYWTEVKVVEADKVDDFIKLAFSAGFRKKITAAGVDERRKLEMKKVRKTASTEALYSPE